MQNKFFEAALNQAAGMTGKKSRLLRLLSQLALKLQNFKWDSSHALTFKEKMGVMGRLSKAYITNQYRDVSPKTMLGVVGAIIYFINPFDFLPDLLPLTGFIDDFAILMWVYNSINSEVDKFLTWENRTAR